MNLLIDCGNTRIKWALLDQEGVLLDLGAAAHTEATNITDLLEFMWATLEQPTAVWLANVAGEQILEAISTFSLARWGLNPNILKAEPSALGLHNAYTEPTTLGVDRWLGMLAAWHKFKKACMIVDLGTCLTVDVIDPKGQHLGGLIVPGQTLMEESIQLKTAACRWNVDHVALSSNEHLLGTNTQSAVHLGTKMMQIAFLERLYEELSTELRIPLKLILTGGASNQTAALLRLPYELAPNLVLEGIAAKLNHSKLISY